AGAADSSAFVLSTAADLPAGSSASEPPPAALIAALSMMTPATAAAGMMTALRLYHGRFVAASGVSLRTAGVGWVKGASPSGRVSPCHCVPSHHRSCGAPLGSGYQ